MQRPVVLFYWKWAILYTFQAFPINEPLIWLICMYLQHNKVFKKALVFVQLHKEYKEYENYVKQFQSEANYTAYLNSLKSKTSSKLEVF